MIKHKIQLNEQGNRHPRARRTCVVPAGVNHRAPNRGQPSARGAASRLLGFWPICVRLTCRSHVSKIEISKNLQIFTTEITQYCNCSIYCLAKRQTKIFAKRSHRPSTPCSEEMRNLTNQRMKKIARQLSTKQNFKKFAKRSRHPSSPCSENQVCFVVIEMLKDQERKSLQENHGTISRCSEIELHCKEFLPSLHSLIKKSSLL